MPQIGHAGILPHRKQEAAFSEQRGGHLIDQDQIKTALTHVAQHGVAHFFLVEDDLLDRCPGARFPGCHHGSGKIRIPRQNGKHLRVPCDGQSKAENQNAQNDCVHRF
jgi:hypothetical protein